MHARMIEPQSIVVTATDAVVSHIHIVSSAPWCAQLVDEHPIESVDAGSSTESRMRLGGLMAEIHGRRTPARSYMCSSMVFV